MTRDLFIFRVAIMLDYTYFFIRTILLEHDAHLCSKFKSKLRSSSLSRRTKSKIFS